VKPRAALHQRRPPRHIDTILARPIGSSSLFDVRSIGGIQLLCERHYHERAQAIPSERWSPSVPPYGAAFSVDLVTLADLADGQPIERGERPSRWPISLSLARSAFDSLGRPCNWAFRIRFSAIRYSLRTQ
jgi:hypothetical protein